MNLKIIPSIISIAFISSTYAAVLISDDFSTNGNLNGSSPDMGTVWDDHSGTTNLIQVINGAAMISNADSGEDVHTQFTATVTTGSVFYSFDLSVATISTFNTVREYFAHFATPGVTDHIARLSVVDSADGDYTLNISNSSAVDTNWDAGLSFDLEYQVVVGYSYDTGESTLWVNATSINDAGVTTTTSDSSGPLGSFAFRQADSGGNEQITVDNLIVTTTFAEVIPEPSSVLLSVLSASLLILRRKRASI